MNSSIIINNESRKVEVYSSFYVTEPVSKMPYLHWESELKLNNQTLFESDHWNMADLFVDYFKKRWEMEKEKTDFSAGYEKAAIENFLYAPTSARKKCSEHD